LNRNLGTDIDDDSGFRRPSGRPVFVNRDDFDPTDTDINEATVDDQFFALYEQTLEVYPAHRAAAHSLSRLQSSELGN
jgi:hypothetical protein